MRRKNITIIAAVVVLIFGAWWYGRAQSESGQDMSPAQRLAKLESKLDTMSMRQQSAQDDVRKKLDQILANQATIISQLEIVKVRATLK